MKLNKHDLILYNLEKRMYNKENTNSTDKVLFNLNIQFFKRYINEKKKSEAIWTHFQKHETSNSQQKKM